MLLHWDTHIFIFHITTCTNVVTFRPDEDCNFYVRENYKKTVANTRTIILRLTMQNSIHSLELCKPNLRSSKVQLC